MANVLSISSQVVYGHVGNSTTAFVLQRMGHGVLSLPTIILSNRPGYKAIAGERTDPQKLAHILEALQSNGWLAGLDAVLTGYLPSPEHVMLCAHWIAKLRLLNPRAIYLCDPIIGDEPDGIYVDEASARSVRDLLVPLADIVTPNAFELGWLSDHKVSDPAAAVSAAQSLSRPAVLATSAPAGISGTIANILIEAEGCAATVSPLRAVQAHGTGDFFASNFLAHKLNGLSSRTALRAAAATIDLVLDRSDGRTELPLVETQADWANGDPPLAALARLPGITLAP